MFELNKTKTLTGVLASLSWILCVQKKSIQQCTVSQHWWKQLFTHANEQKCHLSSVNDVSSSNSEERNNVMINLTSFLAQKQQLRQRKIESHELMKSHILTLRLYNLWLWKMLFLLLKTRWKGYPINSFLEWLVWGVPKSENKRLIRKK